MMGVGLFRYRKSLQRLWRILCSIWSKSTDGVCLKGFCRVVGARGSVGYVRVSGDGTGGI